MSKLIFGGVILAGIMNLGVNNALLLGSGFAVVIIFAMIGFSFYNNSK